MITNSMHAAVYAKPRIAFGSTRPLTGKIGNTDVKILVADMRTIEADAYVIPQFRSNRPSVTAQLVHAAGAHQGIQSYFDLHEKPPFGTALEPVVSGGGRSKKLIHVVSVASGSPRETVATATHNALKRAAADESLTTIVFPALGTGSIDSLSFEESASAMMEGIQRYNTERTRPLKVIFVVYDPLGSGEHELSGFSRAFDRYKT